MKLHIYLTFIYCFFVMIANIDFYSFNNHTSHTLDCCRQFSFDSSG